MATRAEFVERIIDEVTEGRSIPASPKKQRIEKIIDTALRYFRQYDDDVHEFEYIVIKSDAFNQPLFKKRRQIKMPDCVHAITGLQEVGYQYGYQFNEVSPDYRKTNFNFHLALSGDSDTMLYGVVASYYADYMRNFIVRTVSYEYTEHSHMLTIKGRDMANNSPNTNTDANGNPTTSSDLVAEAYVYMCEEDIFESDRFFRYVTGKVKMSFANIFAFTEENLIGGRRLNMNEIKQDGKDLIAEVKEEIDEQKNTLDFFGEF